VEASLLFWRFSRVVSDAPVDNGAQVSVQDEIIRVDTGASPKRISPLRHPPIVSWFTQMHRYLVRLLITLSATVSAVTTATCVAEGLPKSGRAPEIRLHGDRISLPITMVDEYPFIEGEVAGVKGKFMLDTASEPALSINDHRVPLSGGTTLGQGFYGSGQTFEVHLRSIVKNIRIGSLRYGESTQVDSHDATQLEAITPDFLGWIGYWFWDGYTLKLDYQRLRAMFYKSGPADYLRGEQVVAELPFELRKLPNHPIMHVKVGAVDFVAAFDTGQYGAIYTNAATWHRLTAEGHLKPSLHDKDEFDLSGLRFRGGIMASIDGMGVTTSHFPAAKPIGLAEQNIITLGYGFLKQYKTVWDFKRKRIYLLRP